MAIFGFKNIFGRGPVAEASAPEQAPEDVAVSYSAPGPVPVGYPRPNIIELLAPSDEMKSLWRVDAAIKAESSGGMTRFELEKEFSISLPERMPAGVEDRYNVVEKVVFDDHQETHNRNVGTVSSFYSLPNDEAALYMMADPADAPGFDKPRERAEFLLADVLYSNASDSDCSYEETESRLDMPSYADECWREYMMGEPALLVAQMHGDASDEIGDAQKRFFQSMQLQDPSFNEIATVAIEHSDDWSKVSFDNLTSGMIHLSDEKAEMLLASPEVAVAGMLRDQAIAEAFVDDISRRLRYAAGNWQKETDSILAEPREFLDKRYGSAEALPSTFREVAVRETMLEVGKIRVQHGSEHAMEAVQPVRPSKAVPSAMDVAMHHHRLGLGI